MSLHTRSQPAPPLRSSSSKFGGRAFASARFLRNMETLDASKSIIQSVIHMSSPNLTWHFGNTYRSVGAQVSRTTITKHSSLTCHLKEQHSSTVAVKEVWAAHLPGYRGQQGRQEGYPHPGELLGKHQLLWYCAQPKRNVQALEYCMNTPIFKQLMDAMLHKQDAQQSITCLHGVSQCRVAFKLPDKPLSALNETSIRLISHKFPQRNVPVGYHSLIDLAKVAATQSISEPQAKSQVYMACIGMQSSP
ncbi:MAG: hypothetical protein FRX49_07824 [Trebouxia sp. A1-2]|nr:MAG: hypothetical protein FRX49_07824 [Trebouxia sp. A1-2]